MIMNTSTLILVYVRIDGIYCNTIENEQYHIVWTVPKSISPHKSPNSFRSTRKKNNISLGKWTKKEQKKPYTLTHTKPKQKPNK